MLKISETFNSYAANLLIKLKHNKKSMFYDFSTNDCCTLNYVIK